jgi:hypothetical protein
VGACVTLFLFVLFFATARIAYEQFGLEFLRLDGVIRPFELEFWKTYLKYLPWALFQQVCITFLLALTGLEASVWAYLFCVVLFSVVCHFGNWRLMIATAAFGVVVYPFYVFTFYFSVVHIAVLHAFTGTAYKLLGWDMRVWRVWPFVRGGN